jgi:hypothetical protein
MLWQLGGGLGGVALAHLLAADGALAGASITSQERAVRGTSASGLPHYSPRVRRIVQLFMNGGVSQMDTFDYKPELIRRHGEKVDFGLQAAATSIPGAVMKSPFQWKQHGTCGRWVSSVFPQMARFVDDLAFLMAMASKTNVHGPASYMQNTGFVTPGFPCMGAWISYALGSLSENLPSFVVLPDHRGLPYNNTGNFSAGFLPAAHAGTIIKASAATPIANLHPPVGSAHITTTSESEGLKLLRELNLRHLEEHPGDSRLEARISSFELAAKMQLAAPEVLDIARESESTHKQYGLDEEATEPFGRNCLIARRMLEHGVRFVQVWSGMGGASKNWDNHSDIPNELPFIARTVDKPIAALLGDLKQRGMLDDTLVIWTTEFGRMPFTQGATGRDHNGGTFVSWLAGGGIKGGASYGKSDDFSYQAQEGKTYSYDLHATILHLLGIDHQQLSVRHNGIDRRLTDVHGEVIQAILA